jgi:hypothetical protein
MQIAHEFWSETERAHFTRQLLLRAKFYVLPEMAKVALP